MGVVTVPSSASRSPLGIAVRRSSPPLRKPFAVLAFKGGRECAPLASSTDAATITPETVKTPKQKILRRPTKHSKRAKAVAADAAPAAALETGPTELDYNEVAAVLENIYKLSPSDVEENGRWAKRGSSREDNVVRNRTKGAKRLSLEKRVSMKQRKLEERETVTSAAGNGRKEKVSATLVKYSVSTDLNSLDWKKMRIPPVLSPAEQSRLFKLMQSAKVIIDAKENMQKDLNREPRDSELADAVNMNLSQLRTCIEIGQAARNKLIKHNLRLVLFAINKYYPEAASGQKFQDLCQAGAKGLITAIDRFEQKRGCQLSTYSLFWIRHSITRSMILSSFTKVPFGIESVRQEIHKAKLELSFELGRLPTEEEIIHSVGISQQRFHDIMKASKPALSLNARHVVTQEEFIKGVTDVDAAGGDKHRQPALLRLALDDVLDSLKPKESLVIRQRYGLDGKGDRTLGEVAGNLNISRETVRKHELKALLKLKHPTRVDYLRRYV